MRIPCTVLLVAVIALIVGCEQDDDRGEVERDPVGKTPEETFHAAKWCVVERDGDALYDLLSERDRRQMDTYAGARYYEKGEPKETGREFFARRCCGPVKRRIHWVLDALPRYEFHHADVDGDRAKVYATADGESSEDPLPLVREDGLWKIDWGAAAEMEVSVRRRPEARSDDRTRGLTGREVVREGEFERRRRLLEKVGAIQKPARTHEAPAPARETREDTETRMRDEVDRMKFAQKAVRERREDERRRFMEEQRRRMAEERRAHERHEAARRAAEKKKTDVGSVDTDYRVRPGDTLSLIARKSNVTIEQIKLANGRTNDFLREGETLRITRKMPSVAVDKKALTLTLHFDAKRLKTYRIGVGKDDLTPVGTFTVGGKQKTPVWYRPGKKPLPNNDPENILGSRWITLVDATGARRGYGIHGTTRPASVPGRNTAGCIRMLNKDIEELFEWLPSGAKVVITAE